MFSMVPGSVGSMRKYLIFLSYVGHEFRGMQKQPLNHVNGKPVMVQTVQENLEIALKSRFNLLHDVHVFTSSRTDAGVHAVRTSVHVRLQQEKDIPEELITASLNKHFVQNNIGIRILSTHMVPNSFCSRKNALQRTYLYRFAILKKSREICSSGPNKYLEELPLTEYNRTFFVLDDKIDVEKMKEAAPLFQGTKDFFSFMGRPSKQPDHVETIRSIYSLTLSPGAPFMPGQDSSADLFNYWNVTCTGRSFLYRQIRRTVGVLLAVGRGKMSMDDVRLLFDKPEPSSWKPEAVCVPPYGLYLLNVVYNPLHYQHNNSTVCEDFDRTTFAAIY